MIESMLAFGRKPVTIMIAHITYYFQNNKGNVTVVMVNGNDLELEEEYGNFREKIIEFYRMSRGVVK